MKIKIDEGMLVIVPESDEDNQNIIATLGNPAYDARSFGSVKTGNREFDGEDIMGKAVEMRPDGSVEIGLRDAWWNNDE